MLVFNEGVPRSGKSYDAVKSHILVALASGRKVVARLNGLDHAKIAEYLKLPVDRVVELLVLVTTGKVVETFQAIRVISKGEDGELGGWAIPDHLKNALFVIDEVHEFFVAGRQPLPEAVEQFFALHGQFGMDGVIMTQHIKRLHAVIRARIERKNQFQKLTALGMKGRYRVRHYVTVAPDRYEFVDGQTLKYDKAIFPLYAGYADGVTNTEVYDGGGRNALKKLGWPVVLFIVALVVAVPYCIRFFHGDVAITKGQHPAHISEQPKPNAVPAHSATAAQPGVAAPVKSAELPTGQKTSFDTKGMPPEVAYVFEMSQQARPRLAGLVVGEGHASGVIEWRADQGHVLERMDLDTLRSLGVQVEVKPYGLRVSYETHVIVVTSWPVDMPGSVPRDAVNGRESVVSATPSVSEPLPNRPQAQVHDKWPSRVVPGNYVPPEQTTVSGIGS